jgi:hypothetical protein
MYTAQCPVVGCAAVARLWSEMPVPVPERERLVARALSGMGWLWWDGRATCPVHARQLRDSAAEGTAGEHTASIRWALVERIQLRRIEVTP